MEKSAAREACRPSCGHQNNDWSKQQKIRIINNQWNSMLFSHGLVERIQTFSASPSAMFALLPYKTNPSTFYVEVLLF